MVLVREATKGYIFSGQSTKAFRILTFFSPTSFGLKEPYFLGKYFNKPVKYCEFANRQHNKLIYTNINIWMICRLKQYKFDF